MAQRLDLDLIRLDGCFIDFEFEDENGNPIPRTYQNTFYVEFRDMPGGRIVCEPQVLVVPWLSNRVRIQIDPRDTRNLENCFWSLVQAQTVQPFHRTTLVQGRVNVIEGITR
jgi:hypothetical protein